MKHLLADLNVGLNTIAESKISKVPPWELKTPITDFSLRIGKKSTINPLDFHSSFSDVQLNYPNFKFIYTDGSKDGNKVGCAAVTSGRTYKQRLPDVCSVYTAELKAILLALSHIRRSGELGFVICSDSLSALQAIENRNIDHPLHLDILTEHQRTFQMHKVVVFCWVPSHVDIPGNERADKAARAALDLDVTFSRVPHSDFKLLIHTYLYAEWQSFWDEQVDNKLHKVKPTIGCCTPINEMSRRDQLVMSRARIGHTYLTQGYLLRGEEAPVCVPCRE